MSEEEKQTDSRQQTADSRKKVKKDSLQKKYDELEHKYKRALADYQNLLKRTAQEKQEFFKFANEQLLFEILPVYDNLKMSLVHIDEEVKKNGWAEGIKHVVKQFRSVLSNLGVEEIKTVGEKFDPKLMEAVKGKGSKVKKEIRPGYKLNGKVIVPAKVIVE
jgi:molecular chaperone GrpE